MILALVITTDNINTFNITTYLTSLHHRPSKMLIFMPQKDQRCSFSCRKKFQRLQKITQFTNHFKSTNHYRILTPSWPARMSISAPRIWKNRTSNHWTRTFSLITEREHFYRSLNTNIFINHWTRTFSVIIECEHFYRSLNTNIFINHWTRTFSAITECEHFQRSLNANILIDHWTRTFSSITEREHFHWLPKITNLSTYEPFLMWSVRHHWNSLPICQILPSPVTKTKKFDEKYGILEKNHG